MTAPVVRVPGFRKTCGSVVGVDEIALSGLSFPIASLPPLLRISPISARIFRWESRAVLQTSVPPVPDGEQERS